MSLQEQFPLSPKKFTKKIIQKLAISILGALGIGALADGIITVVTLSDTFSFSRFVITGLVLFIVAFVAILAPYAWYVRAYIRSYFYDSSDNFITIRKGVFAPTEIHVQYQKIQDVYVDQDILDRLMGLYDVHIASATVSSGIEAHIDGVEQAQAEGLKNFLLAKIQGQSGGPAAGSTPQVNKQISSSQQVTSDQFPISLRWLYTSAMWSIIHATYTTLLIVFLVFNHRGRDGSSTLSEDIGLHWSSGWLFGIIGLAVVIGLAHFVWQYIWRSKYRFEFSPEYLMLRSGVISREEKHIPYKAIQNVTMTQGIIDRLFGLSSVIIENAATTQSIGKATVQKNSAIVIPGQPLAKGNELLKIVNSIVEMKTDPHSLGL